MLRRIFSYICQFHNELFLVKDSVLQPISAKAANQFDHCKVNFDFGASILCEGKHFADNVMKENFDNFFTLILFMTFLTQKIPKHLI